MLTQFEELATDHISGATELISRLLAICENCTMGYHFAELREGIQLIEHSQQSLPSLNAVIQILKNDLLPRLQDGEENTEALTYLISLENILEQSGETIAEIFVSKFQRPQAILSFSRSGTVVTGLRHLAENNLLKELIILESRPMQEGIRTARDISELNVPTTLYVDSAMMIALQYVDMVVSGADSISADGYLLNKIGTYPLAILAREREIPFYVLCDSLKFSPQLRDKIYVEDRPAEEVIALEKDDRFKVWNRYFEWMPVDFVTEFITERGALRPDQLSSLAGE